MNRSRTGWLLGITLLVTLAWLCLRSPVPEPDAATAEALEAAAETWWRPGGLARTIPEAEWPPELRRLGPTKEIRVTNQGVFIPFGSSFVEEWGLFVLPKGSSFRPQEGTDPSFRWIRGRIYRYDIKG